MQKKLFMLIGPKGAGKTYIGTLIGHQTPIHFIAVEPIWLRLQPGEDGWMKVEQAIDAAFATHDHVMIESLGAGDGFRGFHQSLSQKYPIAMIRVTANGDTCLARVKGRDGANHLSVTDEQVVAYNTIAAKVSYPWDLELNNDDPLSDNGILDAIRRLI